MFENILMLFMVFNILFTLLFKRDGDIYMAMKDCYQALQLDPQHMKSHFRLARCLSYLKWFEEAEKILKIFRERFPDYANSQVCDNLTNEINLGLANLNKASENSKKLKKNAKKKFKQQTSQNDSTSSSSSDTDGE
jgi:tetratricopeptide (TPR) repeat protein